MATAFKVSFAGGRQHVLPPVHRRSRNGHLAVFVNGAAPIEAIIVPTMVDAIYHALTRDGAHAADEPARGRVSPPHKAALAAPSNEARYLTGVLGLAGGLDNASASFLHPFLADVFAGLGGTPALPVQKVAPTANRLAKIARTNPVFDLSQERGTLATLLVKAAAGLKTPQTFVSHADLIRRWSAHRAAYWAANPMPHEPEPGDWDQREADTLDKCLIDLRRCQILFQGHRWRCGECHHKNWLDLGSLAATLICEVCKTETQAPIDITWLFRPNEFLIESFRDHSTLSLIWILDLLRQRSRSSFFYAGPTEFRFSYEANGSDAEADLLVVADGRSYLCEVKSGWMSLRKADIRKLVDLALRLRPDVALLAVMEEGGTLAADIAQAQIDLLAAGIEWELITWAPGMADDRPYLPYQD